jgi:ABC-type glycerol-3-phosphate transport system permease component
MLDGGLECLLKGWNAFDSVGIPLCRVGMLSAGLECFRQSWNTFVQSWNALERGAMLSRGLDYLSTELACF